MFSSFGSQETKLKVRKTMSVFTKPSHTVAFAANLIYTIAAFSQLCLAGKLDDESAAADRASDAPNSMALPDWLMGFNDETYAKNGKGLDLQHALRSVVDPRMPGYCWVYGCPPLDWKDVDRLNPELRSDFTTSFPKVNTIGFLDPNVMAGYARYVQDYIIVSTTTDSCLKPIVWREGLPANFDWREKMAEVRRIDPAYCARHNIKSIAELADRLQFIESTSSLFSKELSEANRTFFEAFKKSLPVEDQENWVLSHRHPKDPDDINSYIRVLQIFDNPRFPEDRVWLLSVINGFHKRVVSSQKLNSSGLDLLREIDALYTATHGELKSNPLKAELGPVAIPESRLYDDFIEFQRLPAPSQEAKKILESLERDDPTFFPNRNLKQFLGRKLTQILSNPDFRFNKVNYDEHILPTYLTLVADSPLIEKLEALGPMIIFWEVSQLQTSRMALFSDLAQAIASSLEPDYERINIFHELALHNFPQFACDKQSIHAAAKILECSPTSPSALLNYLAQYLVGASRRVASYPSPQRVSEIVDQLGKDETKTKRTLLAMQLVNTPSNILHEKAIQAVVWLKPSIHPDFFYNSFYYIGSHFKGEQLTPEFVKALEPVVSMDPEGLIVHEKHCIFDALARISNKTLRMQSLETLNILLESAPRLKSELSLALPKSQEDYARQIVQIPNLWKLRKNAHIIAEYLATGGNYIYYDIILQTLTDPKFHKESAIHDFFADFNQLEYSQKASFLRNK